MVNNIVISCFLVYVPVFYPWVLGGFWENPLGADEGYHFSKLLNTGHRPFVFTNEVITCVSPPHYPFDSDMSDEEYDYEKRRWKEKN